MIFLVIHVSVFAAARSMVLLDSIQRDRAFSIATNLDAHLKARSHQVCYLEGKFVYRFIGVSRQHLAIYVYTT